jgi:hypothetical protein
MFTISTVPTRHVALLVATLACASGCSGPQVRRLGNGSGPPAYQLAGASTGEIDVQARRLCPGGHVVLSAGVQATLPAADDNGPTQGAIAAGQWLAGLPGNVAQATIVCAG